MDPLRFVVSIFTIAALITFWVVVVATVVTGGSVSMLVALAWGIETVSMAAWVKS